MQELQDNLEHTLLTIYPEMYSRTLSVKPELTKIKKYIQL